jgi:hypothetical protein
VLFVKNGGGGEDIAHGVGCELDVALFLLRLCPPSLLALALLSTFFSFVISYTDLFILVWLKYSPCLSYRVPPKQW